MMGRSANSNDGTPKGRALVLRIGAALVEALCDSIRQVGVSGNDQTVAALLAVGVVVQKDYEGGRTAGGASFHDLLEAEGRGFYAREDWPDISAAGEALARRHIAKVEMSIEAAVAAGAVMGAGVCEEIGREYSLSVDELMRALAFGILLYVESQGADRAEVENFLDDASEKIDMMDLMFPSRNELFGEQE